MPPCGASATGKQSRIGAPLDGIVVVGLRACAASPDGLPVARPRRLVTPLQAALAELGLLRGTAARVVDAPAEVRVARALPDLLEGLRGEVPDDGLAGDVVTARHDVAVVVDEDGPVD